MQVFIDSREQKTIPKLLSYYNKHKDTYKHIDSIEVKLLSSGDLCTADALFGIERKSVKDFIPSLLGGKLKQQLYELRTTYKQPYLIVEGYDGIMDCISKNPQVHPNVIIGAATSALAHNNVPIQFVNGFYIKFVLDTINKLYDGRRQQYENIGYTSIRTTVKGKDDYLKYFVYGLPGVRSKVGSLLMSTFNNSITNIVHATVEELASVKGISIENAKYIKELLS